MRVNRSVFGIVLAAAVLLLLAGPYVFTASPGACGLCHQMRPYILSWEASSHRVAAKNCMVCHATPGLVGGFWYRMALYKELYASLTGAKVKARADALPGVAACQRSGCHSLNRMSSTNGDLKISHRVHVVKAKLACSFCHPGAAHAGVGGRRVTPPMKMCQGCHRHKMAECPYCHVTIRASDATSGAHGTDLP